MGVRFALRLGCLCQPAPLATRRVFFATYTPPQKADFIFNKEPLSWVWHTLRTEVSAVRGTRYHRMHYVRLPRRTRALIWLGLVCLLVVGGCCLALMHMRPILTSLARSRVSNSVSRIVVAAVNDAVRSGQIDYHALIDFEKDEEGHVGV